MLSRTVVFNVDILLSPITTALRETETLTSLLVQLVEDVQQLRVHVVDGLEERQHGAVVGDAAAAHVVALHAVEEGGDGVLQSLQELLVVLLRLSVLVLLLKDADEGGESTRRPTAPGGFLLNLPPRC